MSDFWDVYFTNIDGKAAFIALDLGVAEEAPIEGYDKLIWLSFNINNPNEDGFPQGEEFEILNNIEDSFTDQINRTSEIINIGRLTTVGKRTIFYYSKYIKDLENIVESFKKAYPAYEYDFGNNEDPNWSTYFDFLYPSPYEMQCLGNRNLVENLEESGDLLETPREVSHWLYFLSTEDRETFIERAVKIGFTVINDEITLDGQSYSYGITISRKDSVNLNNINNVVAELFEILEDIEGDYDGWETPVVK